MWLSGPVAEAYIFPRLCPPAPQKLPSVPPQPIIPPPHRTSCSSPLTPRTPPIPPRPAWLGPRGLLLLGLDWRNEEKEEKGRKGREQKPGGYKDSQTDGKTDRQSDRQTARQTGSLSTSQTDRYSKVADMIHLYRRFAMGRSLSTLP